jgi:hypothetical protein
MTREHMEWANTQAYYLQHGTNHVEARKLQFHEFAMYTLEHMVAKLNGYMSLMRIYDDLVTAWYIADRAKPITMPGMTLGEWLVWYEKNVMPALNTQAEGKV